MNKSMTANEISSLYNSAFSNCFWLSIKVQEQFRLGGGGG